MVIIPTQLTQSSKNDSSSISSKTLKVVENTEAGETILAHGIFGNHLSLLLLID